MNTDQTANEERAEYLLLSIHNLCIEDTDPDWEDIQTELEDIDTEALAVIKVNISAISRRITAEIKRRNK